MKNLICIISAVCLFTIISCENKKTIKEQAISDYYPYALSEQDSANHDFIVLTQRLHQVRCHHIKFYNTDSLLSWQKRSTKFLIEEYNQTIPNDTISNLCKPDSMLNLLRNFLNDENYLYSGSDIALNLDQNNSFVLYEIVSCYQRIFKINENFRLEIDEWNNLQKSYVTFVSSYISLAHFNGNIINTSILHKIHHSLLARLADMKNICYSTEQKRHQATVKSREKNKESFQKILDTIILDIPTEPIDQEPENRYKHYKDLYRELINNRLDLIRSFNEWIDVRYSIKDNSIQCLQILTQEYIDKFLNITLNIDDY